MRPRSRSNEAGPAAPQVPERRHEVHRRAAATISPAGGAEVNPRHRVGGDFFA